MKKQFNETNPVLIIIFLLAIFSFLIFLPVSYITNYKTSAESLGNNRVFTDYSKEKFSTLKTYADKIEVTTENLLLNRFPMYDNINSFSFQNEYTGNTFLYQHVLKGSYTNIPVTSKAHVNYYINNARGRFIRLLDYSAAEMEEQNEKAASYYNQVYQAIEETSPGVNLYIYAVPLTWHSKQGENNLYPYDEYMLFDSFKANLNQNISAGIFYIEDMDKFDQYFYKTDHHWNPYGAYVGYGDMLDMLAKNYKDIGSPRKVISQGKIAGLEFRGSMARTTLVDKYFDEFNTLDVELPEYALRVNDNKAPQNFSMKEAYEQGGYPKDMYANHYANYFHTDYAKLQYTFGNSPGRNLLFIADSYSNCMEAYLASHFDNAYVIDIRFYEKKYNQPEWLTGFIKDNKITDVMILSSTNGIWRSYVENLGIAR